MARFVQNSETGTHPERRAARRFAIGFRLKYRAFRHRELVGAGVGRTLNMSSGGILFQPDIPLDPDLNLEVLIDWPTASPSHLHLQLLAFGTVVRTGEHQTAVRMVRHEFQRGSS